MENKVLNIGEWTNGTWVIKWIDSDTIKIFNSKIANEYCLMHGGDFESVISGLCAAYSRGHSDASKKSNGGKE